MREIKFRGQTRRKGEKVRLDGTPIDGNWVYGGVMCNKNRDFALIYQSEPIIDKFSVYANTVGQYTGLKDKNGKEIYEGDIFKFPDEVWTSSYTACGTEYDSWEVKNYGLVGFDKDTARFDFVKYKYGENSVEADLHENHDLEFAEFIQELEVVGNIYDNPELLESEDVDD